MGHSKQYAERANVLKKIHLGQAWRFAPAVVTKGKIVRDRVWVSGRDEHHPEGKYYLEWYQTGKRRRPAVGKFETVLEAARLKALEIQAVRAGLMEPCDRVAAARTAQDRRSH